MEKLKIRKDRTPAMLRKLAKVESDVRVARRLLAIANALCGMSRAAAAESAGLDRQTLRDWVIRYNAHGVEGSQIALPKGTPKHGGPDVSVRRAIKALFDGNYDGHHLLCFHR